MKMYPFHWFAPCALVIALALQSTAALGQSTSLVVGMVTEKAGKIFARIGSTETPLDSYSAISAESQLRIADKSTATLVHNKAGTIYVVRGPAIVLVSMASLTVQPESAVVSKSKSTLPVEASSGGSPPTSGAEKSTRAGGEQLGNSRAGLQSATPVIIQPQPTSTKPEKPAVVDRELVSPKAVEAKSQAERKAIAERAVADAMAAAASKKAPDDAVAAKKMASDDAAGASKKAADDAAAAKKMAADINVAAKAEVAAKAKTKSPEELYDEGEKAWAEGKQRAASAAFAEAALRGHGPSQKRMWEIAAAQGDSAAAAKWQRMAFENSVAGVPRPKNSIALKP